MQRISAYAALVMAAGLLGLQVVAAVEYTQGGTLYAQASMIAALVTVAALPVFIEAARRVSLAIAGALLVAFVALLAYSLPAQIGRAGEVKESKARGSEAVAMAKTDLVATSKRLEWARGDWIEECRSGVGKQCNAKRQTVEALEARVTKLKGEVSTAPVGDVASETLAWASAGMVSAETIRRGSVLAFVLGLDVSIWALIWFATKVFGAATVSETVPAKKTLDWTGVDDLTDDQLEQLRRLILSAGRPLNNNEVAALAGVRKGTASKWVSSAVDRGLLSRRRVGREVAITVH